MITAILTEFLRLLDTAIGVQGRNILLFVDNHAAYLQEQNVKFVNYPSNCVSVMPYTTECGWMLKRMVLQFVHICRP
jgi:hypothetical protein